MIKPIEIDGEFFENPFLAIRYTWQYYKNLHPYTRDDFERDKQRVIRTTAMIKSIELDGDIEEMVNDNIWSLF